MTLGSTRESIAWMWQRLAVLALAGGSVGCGRAHYDPADAAVPLDTRPLDAPERDAPGLDSSTPDSPPPVLDVGMDAPPVPIDARADSGPDAPRPNVAPVARSGYSFNTLWPGETGFDVSDADGDPLSIVILRGPEHGTLGPAPGWLYDPMPGFRGVDSVVFAAFDGRAYSNIAEVHFAVTRIPEPRPFPLVAAPVSACTTLSTPGDYELAADLSAVGDCIVIAAPDVTLLGRGHTITGDGTGIAIRITSAPRARLVDVTIERFVEAVHVRDSPATETTGITARNISSNALTFDGTSDDAAIQSILVEDSHLGVFVTTASRANIVGVTGNRLTNAGVHFYDESSDDMVVDGHFADVGRAVSCDRCQRMSVVGVEAVRPAVGLLFIFNCSGHHVGRVDLLGPDVGVQFEHWGGCGNLLLSDLTMSSPGTRAVQFIAGSAHGPVTMLNPTWAIGDEDDASASSSSREHHVVVRALDPGGAPLEGIMLNLVDASGGSVGSMTDAAGLTGLFTVRDSVESGGARTSFLPYEVRDGSGRRLLADLPLTRSIIDVVVP